MCRLLRRPPPTSGDVEASQTGIDVMAAATERDRYSEPPPGYEEALNMPRTTSGHVVVFSAGDVDQEKIYFRFMMTDDPLGAQPPIFVDHLTISATVAVVQSTNELGRRETRDQQTTTTIETAATDSTIADLTPTDARLTQRRNTTS